MKIQRSICLLGAASALASGLAFAPTASASPCIFSSSGGTESGSILSSLHNLSNKVGGDSLWRFGILASSLAAIGGGMACDLRRRRQAAIAAEIEAAELDTDFEVGGFAIAVPPETIASNSSVAMETEAAITR